MGRLLEILEGYDLGDIKEDNAWLWTPDPKCGFSVNSFMRASAPMASLSLPSGLI